MAANADRIHDITAAEGPSAEGPSSDLQVVARVAALLRLISPAQPRIRFADAVEALGLRKSTAHRYLASLEHHGFLRRVDGATFELGPLADQLAALSTGRWRVMEAAAPLMLELSAAVHQTAVLSVWGGAAPVITRVVEDTSQLVHVSVRVGSTLPIDSAQGMVYLAHLSDARVLENLRATLPEHSLERLLGRIERIREDGMAVWETVSLGVRAIAVPVFDGAGTIEATLAVVGTINGIPADLDSGLAQALRQAGQELTDLISGRARVRPPAD